MKEIDKRNLKSGGSKSLMNVSRPLNRFGRFGKRLLCLSCGSFRHLIRQCPYSWENIQNCSCQRKKSEVLKTENKCITKDTPGIALNYNNSSLNFDSKCTVIESDSTQSFGCRKHVENSLL